MIRHIVMWKFREGTEEKADEFLTKLAALDGVIPQLKKCEVARNIGEGNYDAVLVSEFESMDDLNAYKVDPRHVAVSDICKSIRADRVAVDTKCKLKKWAHCICSAPTFLRCNCRLLSFQARLVDFLPLFC